MSDDSVRDVFTFIPGAIVQSAYSGLLQPADGASTTPPSAEAARAASSSATTLILSAVVAAVAALYWRTPGEALLYKWRRGDFYCYCYCRGMSSHMMSSFANGG